MLGHVSAEMSLRYGRLFDATVREEYERALALAKARLGPVLPAQRTPLPIAGVSGGTGWKDTPLIKARLAGGYCLRTAAQGPCAYANICEHCPNFRNDPGFLPILAAQRADAEALAERRPCPRLGKRSRPPPQAHRTARLAHVPGAGIMTSDHVVRVEQACHDLLAAGQPATIAEVAARSGIGRSTLYRHPELRAVIDDHRQHQRDALTLTGLAVQIDQLRKGIEALAAKVRRHEEQLRRLSRRT